MEFKSISGGKMVTDFDDSSIPKNFYPSGAINLRNGKYIGSVASCGGNTVSALTLPDGVNDTIASVVDREERLIYSLVRNSNQKHSIVELNVQTNESQVIFQNLVDSAADILNWGANTDISSLKFIDGGDIDAYGNKVSNILVWTEATTEIRYLNIGKSRKYTFLGNTTVVNSGGVCTVSNSTIIPSTTLRYVSVDGVNWLKVSSVATGSLVVQGTVADGTYTGVKWSYRDLVQLDETVLIKQPPLIPVTAIYQDDATISYNNLRGDLYQFIYAYVYDDNEQSAWSVTSKVSIPQSDFTQNDLTSLKDNSLLLSLNTGSRGVKGIKVAFRKMFNSPNNYYQAKYIDKSRLNLSDNSTYSLSFLNNESYIPVPVSETSNLDQDYVPRRAGCLELINNGSLVFGDVTNGYNQEPVDASLSIFTETLPVLTSTLAVTYNQSTSPSGGPAYVQISGTVYPGDTVDIATTRRTFANGNTTHSDDPLLSTTLTVGTTETLQAFAYRVLQAIFQYCTSAYTKPQDNPTLVVGTDDITLNMGGILIINSINVTATTTTHAVTNAELSVKTGSAYKLGFVYGDHYGRKSPVAYNDSCYIPTLNYHDLNNLFQGIQWQINSQPPKWAEWYAVVATKNLTHLNTYYGVAEKLEMDTTKPNIITVFIENMNEQFTANGVNFVNYNYAVNDRFRFLAKVGSNAGVFATYFDSEILSDTMITESTVAKRVLTIRLPNNFDTSSFSLTSGTVSSWVQPILFEAFSPKKTSDIDNVFYHIGAVFPISNPGQSNRYHNADTQNQTSSQPAIGKIRGIDCFIKPRLMPYIDNDPNPTLTTVEDFNLSDYRRGSFTSIGTPTVEDSSYREVRRKTTLMHTDPFIPQTNINGLNRVYPGYFKDYDITLGAFRRLISKGNYMQAIHESDSQRIPVNNTIISTADGAMQLGLSSELLNDGILYKGGYGLGNNGSALVDTGFFTYILDGAKGVFARLGLDGWDDIALACAFSKGIFEACAPYKSLSNKIKLGYDPYHRDVIIAFNDSDGVSGKTLAYSEKLDGFITEFSYIPESLQSIGEQFYTFKNGLAWLHDETSVNNWYGQQYTTSFDIIVNDEYQFAKICRFIKVYSNVLVSPVSISTDTGGATTFFDNMFDIEVSTDYDKGLVNTSIDGVFTAPIPMDQNSEGGVFDGLPVRGKTVRTSFTAKQNTIENRFQGMFLGYVKL